MDHDALARIGDALAAEPDRQRALELLLTEARRLTRAQAGTVYLREGDRLRFAAVQNDLLARRFGADEARRRLAAGPLALVEPSVASYVALTRAVVNIPHVDELPRERPRELELHWDALHRHRAQSAPERPGARRLGSELVAEMRQVDAHVVGLVGVRRSPDVTKQLRVGDDLARVPNERRQELVLDRRQAHLPVAHEHLPTQEIQPELPDLERRVVALVRGARGVAERDPDPCEELARAEGLADVVVGAHVEGRHLVALLTARGQDDDRDVSPLAQPADHVDAVDVGQPEIDDDDVRLARADLHQAVGARRRLEQPVPLPRQGGA